MITIELNGVNIECGEAQTPTGDRIRLIIYTDPQSGLRIVVPHDDNAARIVAAHLDGRPAIHVANGVPPLPPGLNREQRRHPGGV